MGMTAEDKWARENGLPTRAELWEKLCADVPPKTVSTDEFFLIPQKFINAMREVFSKPKGKGGD